MEHPSFLLKMEILKPLALNLKWSVFQLLPSKGQQGDARLAVRLLNNELARLLTLQFVIYWIILALFSPNIFVWLGLGITYLIFLQGLLFERLQRLLLNIHSISMILLLLFNTNGYAGLWHSMLSLFIQFITTTHYIDSAIYITLLLISFLAKIEIIILDIFESIPALQKNSENCIPYRDYFICILGVCFIGIFCLTFKLLDRRAINFYSNQVEKLNIQIAQKDVYFAGVTHELRNPLSRYIYIYRNI